MLRKELKHLFLLRLNYCFGLQIPNDCQKLFVFHSFSYMDFIYTNRFYICVQSAVSDLRIAREMETAGKDAKTIKRATGWERGGDGKWRMEIPDLKIKREETLPDGTKYAKSEFSLKFHDGALASPERAAKGDVKVGKRAKKIFKKTEEELRRWENWPTDAGLRQEMLSRFEDRSKESTSAERPGGAVEPQSGVGEQSAEDAGEREANVQAKQELVQGTLNWENGKRYSLNTVNVPETPKDMPAPEDPKALRNWLKDFYKGKAKPVNSDTNWSISVPATGLKETLNHLYRKRGSYRRDLHFRSLTAIDSMLEQAKFDRFEDVQNEKKGDKVSIFNVLVDFGEDGIYNARMVVKHFGEDKNYYDHRLTKFEEVPIPRLLPEGSGRHSTSSDNTISSETEKSSGVEKKSDVLDKADGRSYSLRRQVNPIIEDGEIRREYQDLLNDRDYTPERIAEWDKTAIEWIERQGGIQNAAELIANSTEHNDRHVATLVRRHVMNSEVFRELSPEVWEEVEYQNLKEGTSWGREGAARRLAAMTLDSIERVGRG